MIINLVNNNKLNHIKGLPYSYYAYNLIYEFNL